MVYGVSLRYKESANVRCCCDASCYHRSQSSDSILLTSSCVYVCDERSAEWCAMDVLPNSDLPQLLNERNADFSLPQSSPEPSCSLTHVAPVPATLRRPTMLTNRSWT